MATETNRGEEKPQGGTAPPGAKAEATEADGLAVLKRQHKAMHEALGARGSARERLRGVARAWIPHAALEEELVFSAVDATGEKARPFRAAELRRDVVTVLLADAMRGTTHDEDLQARLDVLEIELKALMQDEEKPDGLYAQAGKAGVDFAALGERIAARATALEKDAEAEPDLPEPRSLRLAGAGHNQKTKEERPMARRDMSERDDRGRFMSDEDDRDYGRRSFRGRDGDRDDEGRFMPGNGYRFGRDDDDRRHSRDDGRQGGYGDRERRFEFGRRDEGPRYDDDRRYSRGRDDDRYERDRGQGGWFGDSDGHADAARRGWEGRDDNRYGRGRDDDDRRYGRSRDDDDDRRYGRSRDDDGRYSRDRGQGGWFGDRQAHADAARRGWDRR